MVSLKNSHAQYGQSACCVCNSHGSLVHNSHQHKVSETSEASHALQENLFSFDIPQVKKHIDQFVAKYAIVGLLDFFHPLH